MSIMKSVYFLMTVIHGLKCPDGRVVEANMHYTHIQVGLSEDSLNGHFFQGFFGIVQIL